MFVNLIASLMTVTLATGALAAPVDNNPGVAARGSVSSVSTSSVSSVSSVSSSFDSWGGISSLAGFDKFYGIDDFAHFKHFSPVVVRQSTSELVCHSQKVEIVQQRLAVLQELAKRIVTEQFCEVETQTIVFAQYHATLGGFFDDLRRTSTHPVGFDAAIAAHFGSIQAEDGTLTTHDLNFTGADIGASYQVPTSNWDEKTSYSTVNKAYRAARIAALS
ncbi:Amidohydro-rel domain-containing protein [Mycena indigotica]|uniref:Amidohydro-rel domain-containing protein n=1 Tax=Mycena indigotica TaxID=2126181 RepID=A0A8H6SFK0_9AGAR|nr:Amidohydro-rel domain-containing protein [Mycena indigotica]KAF7298670.1 Amidohydro-rel domain-containing protein [Mycena indigotica]